MILLFLNLSIVSYNIVLHASCRQNFNYKPNMTAKSLTFYLLILFIGSFLYLSVIFSYGLSAPFHVLIIWLMYDRFLSTQKSELIINKTTFSIIPCFVQNLIFFVYFVSTGDLTLASIGDLYFSWIGLILILVTGFEFFLLQEDFQNL